jgi:murein DD-endopeptidase MepM/ murein hydrolase activator NlpD
MHLSKVYADVGDTVSQGDKIGLTGGAKGDKFAGNSTGPHLHWGVAENREYVDPLKFVK